MTKTRFDIPEETDKISSNSLKTEGSFDRVGVFSVFSATLPGVVLFFDPRRSFVSALVCQTVHRGLYGFGLFCEFPYLCFYCTSLHIRGRKYSSYFDRYYFTGV